MKDSLYNQLYFQPAMYETARIIGYAGIAASTFWEKAKKLGIPEQKIQDAVGKLTMPNVSKDDEARFELTAEARKLCWQLLGPEPGHPDFERMGRKPGPEEAGHAAKVKKPRGRSR